MHETAMDGYWFIEEKLIFYLKQYFTAPSVTFNFYGAISGDEAV